MHMSESAKRQSEDLRRRDKQPPTARNHDRDRSAGNSEAGRKAQEEAARTQAPSPGEPAGGE